MFDCFLFNLVTISAGKFHKCIIIVCLTVFYHVTISGGELYKLHDYCVFDFLSSILSPFQLVSYINCMIIVCLTVFSFIMSPFQLVSYIKCWIILC